MIGVPPVVLALRNGDLSTARARFDALAAGLELIPDHEPALFEGVFIARRGRPGHVARLARSWEQFDRAFERAEERGPDAKAAADALRTRVVTLLRESGLPGLAEDHLFVQHGPTTMVLSADDALRDAICTVALDPQAEEAFRLCPA